MELKRAQCRHRGCYLHGLNRTFMELKPAARPCSRLPRAVWIAPLWNWNDPRRVRRSVLRRLNRTFMELKLIKLVFMIVRFFSLNRTFMELKPQKHIIHVHTPRVWIAPLWNWNEYTRSSNDVLTFGLNRTFMELKLARPCRVRDGVGFESHLYGIETRHIDHDAVGGLLFESHLYGFETAHRFAALWPLCQFESHLYGIETMSSTSVTLTTHSFESHLYGIETEWDGNIVTNPPYVWIAPLWNWNRIASPHNPCYLLFESHLYGIETLLLTQARVRLLWFESHLYGIETGIEQQTGIRYACLNRTFMELKRSASWSMPPTRAAFESHLYGIETWCISQFSLR